MNAKPTNAQNKANFGGGIAIEEEYPSEISELQIKWGIRLSNDWPRINHIVANPNAAEINKIKVLLNFSL